MNELIEIQFQAQRIKHNRLDIVTEKSIFEERAIYMMAAIIEFFDSALVYFSKSILDNLSISRRLTIREILGCVRSWRKSLFVCKERPCRSSEKI